jgi:pyruvate kinase
VPVTTRRTRIFATLGPASADAATIRALLEAGVDAFRLNFSHGTIGSHTATCQLIRETAASCDHEVAVLQDLGGPKIRTGPVAVPMLLTEGSTLVITQGDAVGEPGRISSPFDALFTSVQVGHHLLIDDGRIDLEVTAVAPHELTTRVAIGGTLDSHKGINVPGVPIRTSALTPKDLEDLRAGIAMGVDLVALSFVQTPEDVRVTRAAATSAGAPDLPIIAKIERPQAVEQCDEILAVSDGVMVARGDLGIELPFETLPAAQRRIVLASRRHGVPVMVATQVLESMRTEARPTRAEVTDAAHAVDEGVDSILLAGETAVGKYPVRAVQTLDTILRAAEGLPPVSARIAPDAANWSDHGIALCEAAVALADRAKAAAIVAVTQSGQTARMLAALRPSARILAATATTRTAARLAMVWGVRPIVIEREGPAAIRDVLVSRAIVPSGAAVVFVAMRPALGRDATNFVHIERL